MPDEEVVFFTLFLIKWTFIKKSELFLILVQFNVVWVNLKDSYGGDTNFQVSQLDGFCSWLDKKNMKM
jgi:hypothetical protein